MDIQFETLNPTRQKAIVIVDAETVKQVYDESVKKFVANVVVPGFRKGKAPKDRVERQYADRIQKEWTSELGSKAYDHALGAAAKQWRPYRTIDRSMETPKVGESFPVTFVIDVIPHFQLPESLSFPVSLPEVVVSDEEVNQVVETLRRQRADYVPVERPVQAGDAVRLNYEGTLDGTPIKALLPKHPVYGTQRGTWERAGITDSLCVEGVVHGVIGMSKGESKEVTQTFPDDFEHAPLAGKTAMYRMELQDVREIHLPELNEEFLRHYQADSVEALKASIKEQLTHYKESQNDQAKRQQILTALLRETNLSLPESARNDETYFVADQYMKHMAKVVQASKKQQEAGDNSAAETLATGLKFFEDVSTQDGSENLLKEIAPNAAVGLAFRIILGEVAKQENLKLEPSDVERALNREIEQHKHNPNEFTKALQTNEVLRQRFLAGALAQKALDYLAEKATLTVAEQADIPDHSVVGE